MAVHHSSQLRFRCCAKALATATTWHQLVLRTSGEGHPALYMHGRYQLARRGVWGVAH